MLENFVVLRSPTPTAAEFPAVDKIADNVQVLRLVLLEKSKEFFGLRMSASQMNVTDEERPHSAALPVRD
jgi:hypothetical protein